MTTTERTERYFIFIVGLLINSLGVSLITKANLGTSPISSIPYVLSLNFPFSLGTFTVLFSLLLIFLQLLILRKDFKLEHVLQIPVSIAFGIFIDVSMGLLGFVNPQTYPIKVLNLLIGCIILGVGVYMEVLADVVMLPGESFVRAVVFRWKRDFGMTKITFDVSMTVIAAALSLIFSHKLYGVREGTIAAALLVGFIARMIGGSLAFLPAKLFPRTKTTQQEAAVGHANICIAIGRQYGSGGHTIGKQLAKELSFDFYDKEIIQMAAGSTGYSPEFIERHEEKLTNSFLYDLVTQMYAYSAEKNAPRDAIFEAERKIVMDAAAKRNCVIVGRCSDALLKDDPNCLRIFLYAPMETRVSRIMEAEGISEAEAKKKIQQADRRRSEYYRYYSHEIWGSTAMHQICIDTSVGREKAMELIHQALAIYMPQADLHLS